MISGLRDIEVHRLHRPYGTTVPSPLSITPLALPGPGRVGSLISAGPLHGQHEFAEHGCILLNLGVDPLAQEATCRTGDGSGYW